MSEPQPAPFVTDPEIARRIRQTADDLAVERRRATAASEGLEADLRELADEVYPGVDPDAGETMGGQARPVDHGRSLF